MPPRRLLIAGTLLGLVLVAVAAARARDERARLPLRLGVVADARTLGAAQLAADEVNRAGGVLGRPLQLVRADVAHPGAARASVDALVRRQRVAALLGGGPTSIRQAIEVAARRHDLVLLATEQHEGLEQSDGTVHLAAAPNQRIVPAVHWATDRHGDRVAIVRSTDPVSRVATQLIRDRLRVGGAHLVTVQPLRPDARSADTVVRRIVAARPDVVLNTADGATTDALTDAMRGRRFPPLVSFQITEADLDPDAPPPGGGHWVAGGYFQLVRSPENTRFVEAMQRRMGEGVVTAPMEAAYVGVHLWAGAVRDANSTESVPVRQALASQTMHAPEGLVSFDTTTQHLWKTFRMGKVHRGGLIEVVESSLAPLRPEPFPTYRPASEWKAVTAR